MHQSKNYRRMREARNGNGEGIHSREPKIALFLTAILQFLQLPTEIT